MSELMNSFKHFLLESVHPNLRTFAYNREPLAWVLAAIIGIAIAYAIIAFRLLIGATQYLWLGTMSEKISSQIASQPVIVIILVPAIGGLVVGLFLQFVMPLRRPEGVADVIEARAIGGARMPFLNGLGAALVSAVSLGSGASAGREGPAVHLGATLSSSLAQFFKFPPHMQRTLLACGAAAAVSASFNAPIAGALFAMEVILVHLSPRAFVPIIISSVTATIVTRFHLGSFPAFIVPDHQITSYLEFPAFALLGITCGIVAICFQSSLSTADWVARHITCPLWARPVIGGLMVGSLAVFFPQILGVGYEATDAALNQQLPLLLLLLLIPAKTIATAITLASRFGGGVFSPSLYLGAMTGGAFGIMATSVFPEIASSNGLYAIVGMGAVAAAILGAPISTTLIVFELTGGYEMTLAIVLTISISTGLMQAVHGRSFFHWQLGTRGLFLNEGPHKEIVRNLHVSDFMVPLKADETAPPLSEEGQRFLLAKSDTLETALRAFDDSGLTLIPVVDDTDKSRTIGWARQLAATDAFNKALIKANVEKHG